MNTDSTPLEINFQADARATRILERARGNNQFVPTDSQAQIDWLNEATVDNPAGRYLTEIWRERTDLWETFPGMFLDPDAVQRFRLWAHHFAAAECDAPLPLVPKAPAGITDLAAPPLTGPPPALTPGVQLYGYLRATLGLGEAARRLVSLLTLANEPTLALPYDHIGSPLAYPWPDPSPQPSDAHDIAMLCVNGAETARLTRAIGPKALHGRYRIGLWFWELEQLTPEMAAGLEHLDEVWVTSKFVASAVRNAAPPLFPVHILPLGMDLPNVPTGSRTPTERAVDRIRIGLPRDLAHGVAIGCAFDYASRIARKNPVGLINAFLKAFPKPFSLGKTTGPWLVVKAFNPGATPADAATVRAALGGRPDVVLFEEHLSPEDQRAYISSLDVVASLHRSEGYGLLMLEAMAQGIPTMATEYSGNLAFMSHRNSWLIPAQRITIDAFAEPYPAGYNWAEPDPATAASTLRWIISGLTTTSSRAAADVSNRTNQALIDTKPIIDGTAGEAFVGQRLAEIRTARR